MFYNLIKNKEYYEDNVKFLTVLSAYATVSMSTYLNYILFNYFYWIRHLIEPLSLFRAFPLWFSKPVFIFGSGYIPTVFNFFDKQISANTTEFNDPEQFKIFCGHYPAVASVYNLIDIQRHAKGLPDRDYGWKGNIEKYG